MSGPTKRKAEQPEGEATQLLKKRKGGNNGKWMTPAQTAKALQLQRSSVEPGDVGIWVTCVRGMEGKAAAELQLLFDEYAEKIYGIKPPEEVADNGLEEAEDIETSIRKEINSLKSAASGHSKERIFTPIRIHLECVLFTKTQDPIQPTDFVRRICQDIKAANSTATRKTRSLNRLTPISLTGRATTKGIEALAREVLAKSFTLKPDGEAPQPASDSPPSSPEAVSAYTYAIRPSIRHHQTLKRDEVIKQIASLIDNRHRVNLGSPDKVILVEMYQTVCGIGVVEGDWDDLKRYNIHELSNQATGDHDSTVNSAKPTSGDGKSEVNIATVKDVAA